MSMTGNLLPEGFEALEPFVDPWAAETSAERAHLRLTQDEDARRKFRDAAWPLLDKALAFLDQKPLAAFDEKEQRLMNLTLSLAHVSLAFDFHKEDEAEHAVGREAMIITRTPADA